jgi:hypothetical protein
MGNICPANKGDGSNGYKASREHHSHHQVFKLGSQNGHHYKGGAENANGQQAGYPAIGSGSNGNGNGMNFTNLAQIQANGSILGQQAQNGMGLSGIGSNSSKQLLNGHHNSSNGMNGLASSSLINANNVNGTNTNSLINQQQQLDKPNYIALFDYESATKDDMTIKKNDQLIVIDKSHPDWWLAKNLRTKDTGYVPYNYITSIDDLQIKE